MNISITKFDQHQREDMAERAERAAMAIQSRAGMMTTEDWQELRGRFADPIEADILALFGALDDHFRETSGGLERVTWRDLLHPEDRAPA